MRVFVLATMLLASSSLGSFAQEQGKAPDVAPPTGTAAQTDQKAVSPPDQRASREQQKPDSREMGPDWRLRRSDGDRTGRDDRETGHGETMHRGDGDRIGRNDREAGHGGTMRRGDSDRMDRDRDRERQRYPERSDRDWDRADRDGNYGSYADADRPRHRVKICVEYDNGDEYCRYRR